MEKVLVVEDDKAISEFVSLELKHEGFDVRVSPDGRDALSQFASYAPDAVLLDVMLPGLSGLEVLRRIRKTSSVPVILVTARGETYDKVNGLDAGADDYIAKPFEIEELLARLRAVLRRASVSPSTTLTVGGLVLNTDSMEVTLNGRRVDLSKTEFLLLRCLLSNKGVVLSRDRIIDEVWGEDYYIDENSVDVYVRYLRTKIGDSVISTVRGIGYTIRAEE